MQHAYLRLPALQKKHWLIFINHILYLRSLLHYCTVARAHNIYKYIYLIGTPAFFFVLLARDSRPVNNDSYQAAVIPTLRGTAAVTMRGAAAAAAAAPAAGVRGGGGKAVVGSGGWCKDGGADPWVPSGSERMGAHHVGGRAAPEARQVCMCSCRFCEVATPCVPES